MYCPRCGEEQSSGNLRFCNRCGLPLGLVSEVLSNGGTLPYLEKLSGNKKLLTRKNGIFFSIFWFILFVPFGAAICDHLGLNNLGELSAIFGVFSSMLILLFSLFFLDKSPKNINFPINAQTQKGIHGQQNNQGSLSPPPQTRTAQEYVNPNQAENWKAPDTGELVSPGSVTEGTTKLLSRDEELTDRQSTKYFNE